MVVHDNEKKDIRHRHFDYNFFDVVNHIIVIHRKGKMIEFTRDFYHRVSF